MKVFQKGPQFLSVLYLLTGIAFCQEIKLDHPKQHGMSPDSLAIAFDDIQAAVDSRQIGGAIGLIARNGRIIFLQSAGELGENVPMPTNAITRLASIGKTITAAAMMILYERGQIDLDDKVSDYLPEYADVKVSVNGGSALAKPETPMTIYHLLTHQSGIASDGKAFWGVWDRAKTVREFAAMIAEIPLESHPGSVFRYGQMGSSYELLAAIVRVATNMTFKDFLRKEILDPLKMEDTYFYVPESKRHLLSAIYKVNSNGELIRFRDLGQEEPETEFYAGGGALRSSIVDFFRFAQCLLNGGELEGTRILSRKSVELMTSNQTKGGAWNDRLGWGFGASIQLKASEGAPIRVGAYGWNGGTGTRYMVDPVEKLIAIVFIPSQPRTPGVRRLRNEFIEKAFGAVVVSNY